MANTVADTIATEFPIMTYRFVLSLGDEKVSFKSVTGLDIKYETMEYKDGTGGIFRMPGQFKEANITLSKGRFKGKNTLFEWLSTISLHAVDKRDLLISLTDETGGELLASWSVFNAFPTSLTAPSFDATSNDIVVQEIALIADRITYIAH